MDVDALTNQLVTLSRARRFTEVIDLYELHAIALRSAPVACRLVAAALAERGQLDNALRILLPVASASAADVATLLLTGRVAVDCGHAEQAIEHLRRAIKLDPRHPEIWRWLSEAALVTNQPEIALAHALTHRLRFNSDMDLAYLYVRLLARASRTDEALIEFERLLAHWPHHPELGPAYVTFVTFEFPLQAAECLARTPWRPTAGVLSPPLVRGALALPAFYENDECVARWHLRMLDELRYLTRLAEHSPLCGDERAACLDANMFFVPYAERNVTDLLFAWGDFVEAVVAPLRLELNLPHLIDASRADAPVCRVGFVTNRVGGSSAGRVFGRWIDAAVGAGLQVHVFALGPVDIADELLAQRTNLLRFPEEQVAQWRIVSRAILESRCDLLIYPECQGSALQQILAGLKLAPIQAAGFGNPVTTGLRTMDYFLSPAEAEPDDGDASYREQLVRLTGTWSNVAPPPTPNLWSREAFGLPEDAHVYLVTQPMPKWTPGFRAALREVLRVDSRARLVIVQWSHFFSFRAFEVMLREEFSSVGLSYAERVTVCGWLAHADYMSLHQVADVVLDTFGFSGGVSTVDALASGRAVVTLRGKFLRSRQSAALVQRSGASGNVVDSAEAFVARAIAVARAQRGVTCQSHAPMPIPDGASSEGAEVDLDFAGWLHHLARRAI